MENFSRACKSGRISSIRILLVSKDRPQFGVGVKYSVQNNHVIRTIVPIASIKGNLTPESDVKIFNHISDIHPSLYALLAQAYEYTERWVDGTVSNIEDFIGVSTIGDLYVYRHGTSEPDSTV
jgi:hypothetical protein